MNLPSDETILSLHKKYAPNQQAFAIVYSHCQIIAEIANQLIEHNHLSLDKKLVRAAALLHDIGYYPLFDSTGYVPKAQLITHGVVGAEILKKEGIDGLICRIAERHTGTGLTKENILEQNLPLPVRDLVAETPEEWLVLYVDKLHTKAIQADDPHESLGWFVSPESYIQQAGRFGADNAARFERLIEKYGTLDLKTLAHKYNQTLK
jgi:uncharacterized protein